jgi:hypothetical protein
MLGYSFLMLDCDYFVFFTTNWDNFVMGVSCFPGEVHVAIPTPHGLGGGGASDLPCRVVDSTSKFF